MQRKSLTHPGASRHPSGGGDLAVSLHVTNPLRRRGTERSEGSARSAHSAGVGLITGMIFLNRSAK
jgi:hypothetical protein